MLFDPVEPRFASPMTVTDLEAYLVLAITERVGRRVHGLRVQILRERVVLHGFAESYYAIQLVQAGLLETFKSLDLDPPERIDLNIDVLPSRQSSSHTTEWQATPHETGLASRKVP